MTFEGVLVFGVCGFLLELIALQSFQWAAVPALTKALSLPWVSFLNRLPNYDYRNPVFLVVLMVSAALPLVAPQWIRGMPWRAMLPAFFGPVFIWHVAVIVVEMMLKIIP